MKDRVATAALLVVLTAVTGCGTSGDPQPQSGDDRAGTAAGAVRDTTGASGRAPTPGAGAATSTPDTVPGMTPAASEPVAFRELQGLFPDLDGWTKGKPTGEQVSVGIKMSRAEVRYERGESSMEMEITDSSLNQAMIAPFAMMLATGYEKESAHGFERSAKVGGQDGWERWDSEERGGELNAVVAKRFIVKIAGSNVDDLTPLHKLADSANLARLADMR